MLYRSGLLYSFRNILGSPRNPKSTEPPITAADNLLPWQGVVIGKRDYMIMSARFLHQLRAAAIAPPFLHPAIGTGHRPAVGVARRFEAETLLN